jgi:exodeoxyribonuclease VII large subunit
MAVAQESFKEHPVYRLSDITKSIKSVINRTYHKPYYIKAEILKLNVYPHSGHCYPELVEKENGKIITQFRSVIWASQYQIINEQFRRITGEPLKEGISILCLATIEFNPQYGLALYIQHIEPIYTLGEIAKNRMAVIEKLTQEQLMDANKKLPMALLPKRVAIISVETSKGYTDFMTKLREHETLFRFETELFPSVLQGDKASKNIMQRLGDIEVRKDDFDCVVIVRGGGGDVGLSCYDDYDLAKSVATFPLPIITGIGHAVNETITGMVSYKNMITPTDVAVLLISQFQSFADQIEEWKRKIVNKSSDILQEQRYHIDKMGQQINFNTTQLLTNASDRLISMTETLKRQTKQLLQQEQRNIENTEKTITLLDPKNILKRGFSITTFQGKALRDNKTLSKGDMVVTQLYEGTIESEVVSME